MRETDLSKKQAARIRDRGGFAVKTHGDPRQRKGLPDIIGTYKGWFIGIETKLPGKENTLTKIQAHTLLLIKRAGGLAFMMTTVAQVDKLLNWIDRQEES